jgi:hypothetical protein
MNKKEDRVGNNRGTIIADKIMLAVFCTALGGIAGALSMVITFIISLLLIEIFDPYDPMPFLAISAFSGICAGIIGASLGLFLGLILESNRRIFLLVILIPLTIGIFCYFLILILNFLSSFL